MLVEAVCCSVEDCLAALRTGADRIELCSAIELGGLTPSLGLYEACREAVSIPLMVMIRPRPGGFCYSEAEFDTMLRDTEIFSAASGVVFGVLLPDGSVDIPRMKSLIDRAGDSEVVFHRAFDVTPNAFEALETLIDLGVNRILTSGQAARIEDGLTTIKELMSRAERHIDIQPASGIRPENVRKVVECTGCRMIHLGPFLSVSDPTSDDSRSVSYGPHQVLDEDCLRQVAALAKQTPPSL